MEPVAYGVLGLQPDQFDRLSMQEFYALLDGYETREKVQDRKRAYFITLLIAPQCDAQTFDFTRTFNDIYSGLHPDGAREGNAEDRESFLQTFNL